MKVFEVERNDSCPCGSGRKFKKCCQNQVDDATERLGQAIGEKEYTVAGRDLVETLGFILGLRPEEGGHPPRLETVGRALREAWTENERMAQEDDYRAGVVRLLEMLDEKSYLKEIRVPFWRFTHDEKEDFDIGIMKHLTGNEGYLPTVRAIGYLRMSLFFNDYTEEELKWLFIGLGWLVTGRSELFWENVLQKTKDDLRQAEQKMNELYEGGQERNSEFFSKANDIFYQYPIYKKMLAEGLAKEIKPAADAIMQGKLKIDAGLYAVMSGIQVTVSGFIDSFKQLMAHPDQSLSLQLPLEHGLLRGGDYRFFITDLIGSLSGQYQELPDGELKKAVGQLIVYLSFMFDNSSQLTEYCYLRCICRYLTQLPLTWPETGIEFKEIKDFYNKDLMGKYAAFLASRKMTEEAEHIRKISQSLSEQDEDQITQITDQLLQFARSYVGEEQGADCS